jgi:hypothetical protein
MLIDAFNENFLDELDLRAAKVAAPNKLYLLIDGAFVPGLHKSLASEMESSLFASLRSCNDETADVPPFLTPYAPHDKRMRRLLRRCSGWPMVSVIETRETPAQLSTRLSAWCLVEADGQRFNFRFPDTRRLPAIFQTLDATQRAHFAGHVKCWSYVGRDGGWNELDVTAASADPADNPTLCERQFAALVDDSRADELLMMLSDWGIAVDKHPSLSHMRMTSALRTGRVSDLADGDLVAWCIWFWQHPDADVIAAFQTWKNIALTEKNT